MPTCPIIFTTLKKFKIHYPFEFIVITKFVLPFYHSETHFPYKNLAIAQAEAILFIMFIFCLLFGIVVVEKAFDAAMSTTKLSLCTA